MAHSKLFFDPDEYPDAILKAFDEFVEEFVFWYDSCYTQTRLKFRWSQQFNAGSWVKQIPLKILIWYSMSPLLLSGNERIGCQHFWECTLLKDYIVIEWYREKELLGISSWRKWENITNLLRTIHLSIFSSEDWTSWKRRPSLHSATGQRNR